MNAENARSLLREWGYSLSRKAIKRFNLNITSDVCLDCLEEKPLSQFHEKKDSATGRMRTCKSCHKEQMRDNHATRQSSLFGDELPEMSPGAVDANRRQWGCMTAQDNQSISASWKYQMGNRRFDEPGMEIKERVSPHRHLRLA